MNTRWTRYVEDFLADKDRKNVDYFKFHSKRFVRSLEIVEEYLPVGAQTALEVGAIGLFAHALVAELGVQRCDVTATDSVNREPIVKFPFNWANELVEFRAFNVDLESAPLPIFDGIYDLVLSFEVLEHMSIDPMYHMGELNRALRPGGTLILSTPNITSARSVKSILEGWHPHYFCAYNINHTHDRHNLEYSPQLLKTLIEAAGFNIVRLWAEDLFNDSMPEIVQFLQESGYPTENRGDDLLCVATKSGGVKARYPSLLYA